MGMGASSPAHPSFPPALPGVQGADHCLRHRAGGLKAGEGRRAYGGRARWAGSTGNFAAWRWVKAGKMLGVDLKSGENLETGHKMWYRGSGKIG